MRTADDEVDEDDDVGVVGEREGEDAVEGCLGAGWAEPRVEVDEADEEGAGEGVGFEGDVESLLGVFSGIQLEECEGDTHDDEGVCEDELPCVVCRASHEVIRFDRVGVLAGRRD